MALHQEWVRGFKVEISDWYDGVHDHLNIAYYKPGSSLSRPPLAERGYLILKDERKTIMGYLDSIVNALTSRKDFWEQGKPTEIAVISVEPPKINLLG